MVRRLQYSMSFLGKGYSALLSAGKGFKCLLSILLSYSNVVKYVWRKVKKSINVVEVLDINIIEF
jgi:hypothetical protein